MRHFIGFIMALVLSAALYLAGGWGVRRIIALRGHVTSLGAQHALTSTQGLVAVGAVAGTGLLLGILLAAPRISPLATGLPGLALLGWSALVVVRNTDAVRYLPLTGSTFTTGLTYLLFSGVLALLGAAMIVPLAVPSRWRRRRLAEDDDLDLDDLDVHAALGLIP
jgi:hypothetical protein